MSTQTPAKQDGFKSKWGFIMACIGSAVGMANIWRFPVMVAKYGGMTFLIPYFIFVVLIGMSGVMEEFALGRWGGGPVESFGKATKERWGTSVPGAALGALPVIGAMGLAIGYSVVMGWIFKYTWMGLNGDLFAMGNDMGIVVDTFVKAAPGDEEWTLIQSIKYMLDGGIFGVGNGIWIVVAIAASVIIMCLGVAGGIEKACKFLIPALFGVFLVLAVYIAFLPGATNGYKYIFTLDPKGLLNWEVWIFAFGQAFFSLSVAGNGSVIYGSYLGKDVEISSSARNVALFDTLAALVAMMVIIPAMYAVNADMSKGGPGLMFISLVPVINGMAGGRIVGAFFFVAVLFAGVSSIINLYETPVAFVQEKLKMNRIVATVLVHVIGLAVALLIQPWTSQWMDMVSIYICPFGAALAGIMFFWVMKKETALEAVNEGANKPIGGWFHPFGKWVYVPLCIIALVAGAALGGIG